MTSVEHLEDVSNRCLACFTLECGGIDLCIYVREETARLSIYC